MSEAVPFIMAQSWSWKNYITCKQSETDIKSNFLYLVFFPRNHFLDGASVFVESKQGLLRKKSAGSDKLKTVLYFQVKGTLYSYTSFKISTLLNNQKLHFPSYHGG